MKEGKENAISLYPLCKVELLTEGVSRVDNTEFNEANYSDAKSLLELMQRTSKMGRLTEYQRQTRHATST